MNTCSILRQDAIPLLFAFRNSGREAEHFVMIELNSVMTIGVWSKLLSKDQEQLEAWWENFGCSEKDEKEGERESTDG